MLSVHDLFKGPRACNEQAISPIGEEEPSGNCWSAVRNNSTNAWYVNLGNGNVNNTNTYNRYTVFPASDLDNECSKWIDAEDDCYKNKHSSIEAASYHFHLSQLRYLIDRIKNGYKPTTSICFVLDYPVYREVFAANYTDRIVHHYVARMINIVCEQVHTNNENVSHGNRIGYSTLTAHKQIQDNIKEASECYTKPCFVATMDIKGFFMSIDQQMAYDIFLMYADKYYNESDKCFMLNLIKTLIFHNPTSDCERRSPIEKWDHVPLNKSLFSVKAGKGLPIGNYYSQLIANLFLAPMDDIIQSSGIRYTRFVDDLCIVARSSKIIVETRNKIKAILSEMKLELHPNKFYIQPYQHGVKFCGRVVKPGRAYISNRIRYGLYAMIKKYIRSPSLNNAYRLQQSVNSYFGLMNGTASYYIKKDAIRLIEMYYSEWVFFRDVNNRLICTIKEEYRPGKLSLTNVSEFISKYNPILYAKRLRKAKNRRKKRNINGNIQVKNEIRKID